MQWATKRLVHRSKDTPLFDHLVSAGEQRWRKDEAKRFGGLEVDHQLEFGWLEKGDGSGIGAFEDFVNDVGNSVVDFPEVD